MLLCFLLNAVAWPINSGKKIINIDSINVCNTITKSNSIYVVSGEIDLKGKTIQIPSGCMLDLQKGSISNGVLVGHNTQMTGLHKKCIGSIIKGSWLLPTINDDYFKTELLSDDQIINNVNHLQNDRIENIVTLKKNKYECSISKNDGCLINVSSNTKLSLHTIISIKGNNFISYNIIRIKGKENVAVSGGVLIGDVGKHQYVDGSTSQWGHGVHIYNSRNVKIEKMTVMKCIGDGFAISGELNSHAGDMSKASSNVIVKNVVSKYNRRQGISIIHAEHVAIENSSFSDTGEIEANSPSAGIDIEPNIQGTKSQTVRNLKVENCVFERNAGASILSNHYVNYQGLKSVDSVVFVNCRCDNRVELHTGGINFTRTRMGSLKIIADKNPIVSIKFLNCSINGHGIDLYASNMGWRVNMVIGNVLFDSCSINMPQTIWNNNGESSIKKSGKTDCIGGIKLRNCTVKVIK